MTTQRHTSNSFLPLAVLLAGTFMVVLDFFIVNVALPSMQRSLGAGASATEWVLAGYGVALATLLITAGRLGDAFGRRRLFTIGMVVFTLASAACGASPDAGVLVAGRVAQGIGAALLSPSVLSIIGVLYQGQDRTRALGAYGLVLGLAAVGGQLLGGALMTLDPAGLGWRSVFLINLPIGALALAFTRALVPESRAAARAQLDPLGTLLLTDGLVALVIGLVEAPRHGWPLWSWGVLGGAVAFFAALLLQQRGRLRRGRTALLDPALVRERSFAAGLGLQVLFWAGQASFFLVLALYLQEGRHLSPLQAGGVFTITAAAYLATSLRAPQFTAMHGRRVVVAGALTLCAGHAALLLTAQSIGTGGSTWLLAPGLLLVGAGMGLCVTPLTAISLAPLAEKSAGAASGALSTVQQLGNAIGVAVTGAIFFGGLGGGFAHAFALSAAQLAGLLLAVALLARLLPAPAPRHPARGEMAIADA
jgi:EmrB/QacA subfamily drug resistance transporter